MLVSEIHVSSRNFEKMVNVWDFECRNNTGKSYHVLYISIQLCSIITGSELKYVDENTIMQIVL